MKSKYGEVPYVADETLERGVVKVNRPAEDTSGVRDIPARDLVMRVLKNMRPTSPRQRWAWVEQRFALGSTYAVELCKNFGLDPHEEIGKVETSTPLGSKTSFDEGKKIYDQGWNDALEQFEKLLKLKLKG